MKARIGRGVGPWLAAALALAGTSTWLGAAPGAGTTPPDVDRLLARMTLAEKVGQLTMVDLGRLMGDGPWDRGPLSPSWIETVLGTHHVGALLSGGNAAPVPADARGWARATGALQRRAQELHPQGIPLIYGVDAVHGHALVEGAVVYPHQLGLAASWDPALVEQVARATARDVRATGVHWNFAPVADVARDPRWGRFYETFGEDPTLAAALVAAGVRGSQGEDLAAPDAVAATLKHFVGYSAGRDGRDRAPAAIADASLRGLHLPPFRAGIDAGAATVMVDSGAVNGIPVHASRALLTDVLRGELGFEGVVVSDWHDIHKLVDEHRHVARFDRAVEVAVLAGVDVYMVPHDAPGYTATLIELVEGGRVPRERIDEATRRVLALKARLGLFAAAPPDPTRAAETIEAGDRALARRAAVAGATLLRNRGDVVPLDAGIARVLIAGAAADDPAMQLGGWTQAWQGVTDSGALAPVVTVADGLTAAAPATLEVARLPAHASADAARRAAADADVTIAVLGERPYAEFEGDRADLALPPVDAALLRALCDADAPVVLVWLGGRPATIPAALLDAIDGFVVAPLPGSEGGAALAGVLLGTDVPGGRLPFAWPAHGAALPRDDGDPRPASVPWARLGAGLGGAEIAASPGPARLDGETLRVPVTARHVAGPAGPEVLRVHGRRPPGAPPTDHPPLLGFARVWLAPGETRTVEIAVPRDAVDPRAGGEGEDPPLWLAAPGSPDGRTAVALP